MQYEYYSPDDIWTEEPRALILAGEGLSSMTPERLEMLTEMIGALGLQLTVAREINTTYDLPGSSGEQDSGPRLAIMQDFYEHGRPRPNTHPSRVKAAWKTLEGMREWDDDRSDHPPIRFAEDAAELTVDMRSVYDRLVSTGGRDREAWATKPTFQTLHYLSEVTNDLVQPNRRLYFPPSTSISARHVQKFGAPYPPLK